MKKTITGTAFALLAGVALAQIEQQSQTTSNTSGTSSSRSKSLTKSSSIGALYFPLFAKGAPNFVSDENTRQRLNGCAQIFNGAPYSYTMHPRFYKQVMSEKGGITAMEENDVVIPKLVSEAINTVNYQYERIGQALHHSNAMWCGAIFRSVIELALLNLRKNNKNQYLRPTANEIEDSFNFGIDRIGQKDYEEKYINLIKTNPSCQVPTYTAITTGKRDFVTCGGYSYYPNPVKWIINGVVVLSEDTLNGQRILFSDNSSSEATKGQSTTGERTNRANVAN